MGKQEVPSEALNSPKQFYDARYRQEYAKPFSVLYEVCRLYTVREVLNKIKSSRFNPNTILDYGCGDGRYTSILKQFFPESSIYGSDISDIGLKIAKENHPDAQYISMSDETIDFADSSFDLIISIEVLEHVKNVEKSTREIGRLLKPHGMVLITTPCANKYSLEWFYNKLTNRLQSSFDGYGRFGTDEPAHLRRLNDKQLRLLFSKSGVDIHKIYHRAHLFITIMEGVKPLKILPNGLRVWFALLDWHLFKHLPNGATMVAVGRKRKN